MQHIIYQTETNSPEETLALGEKLGYLLLPGDVVALDGDLGAGKTHFTIGISRALGISDYLTSPTFTIVNEYPDGKIPLFHFDVYRLDSEDALEDIGFFEYLHQNGVIVMEWASNVQGILPEERIHVTLLRQDERSEHCRNICISWTGQEKRGERFADAFH